MIGDDWIVSIKSTNFNSNSCLNPPHSKQTPLLLCGTQNTRYIAVSVIGRKKIHFHKDQVSTELLFTPM